MDPIAASPSTHNADLLEHVLDGGLDAHIALDEAWHVVYANRHAEELLDQSRSQLTWRTVWDVFPAARGTHLESALHLVMGSRERSDQETWLDSPDEALTIRVVRIPEGILITLRTSDHPVLVQNEETRKDPPAPADVATAPFPADEELGDALTGLPDREGFERLLGALLEQPDSWPVSVLFVDLDRFSVINDSLGHTAGDALLVEAADRLGRTIGDRGVVGRHETDTFTVACPRTEVNQTIPLCEQILAAFRQPFAIGGRSHSISASVGVRGATAGSTSTTILRDANAAGHAARQRGGTHLGLFSARTRADAMHRLEVESELRDALRSNAIELHWQPAFDLDTGEISGVEALARWHHPNRGLLLPGAFVPIAEETDLILDLGHHTLVAGVRQALGWNNELGRPSRDFGGVWVNVSAKELSRPSFPDSVAAVLDAMGLDPRDLGLEVTETALFADSATPVENLNRLRELGVGLALDDFGTGYASLTYLMHFPADVVKIDRSFTAKVHDPTQPHATIVSAVIAATHALGGRVLAEGVEYPEQLEALRDLGCDAASGFLLARPAPARELTPRLPGGSTPAGAPDPGGREGLNRAG